MDGTRFSIRVCTRSSNGSNWPNDSGRAFPFGKLDKDSIIFTTCSKGSANKINMNKWIQPFLYEQQNELSQRGKVIFFSCCFQDLFVLNRYVLNWARLYVQINVNAAGASSHCRRRQRNATSGWNIVAWSTCRCDHRWVSAAAASARWNTACRDPTSSTAAPAGHQDQKWTLLGTAQTSLSFGSWTAIQKWEDLVCIRDKLSGQTCLILVEPKR